MKYEDRIQLKVDELTTAFFDHVIAYYLSKPSGLGDPAVSLWYQTKESLISFMDLNWIN